MAGVSFVRKVGRERVQLVERLGSVGTVDPLRELVERQPPGYEVSAQGARSRLSLCVGRAYRKAAPGRLLHESSMTIRAPVAPRRYCRRMDRERFAEATERLQEVDRFVRTLDPAVRAEAFSLLSRYVLERKSTLRDLLDRLASESAELDELLRREYEELFVETNDPDQLELRLQTALDRHAKLLETLSDILKTLSCTEKEIVQNLK